MDSGSPSLYSKHTLLSALSREEVVLHLSSVMRRESFAVELRHNAHNPRGYPAESVGVEGNTKHRCDVLPVFGVVAPCDTVMSHAPAWR